jgi:hypothetical protein
MRTLIFCIILALLSTAYAFVDISRDLQPKLTQSVRIIKTWETGGGERTHTTGHGYYQRRAERGK